MNGALLVDKDGGPTSAGVVRVLRRRFGLKRVGHAGTLDPMATGLLVILVGQATRFQDLIMGGRKVYEGRITLGIGTDTDDVTGDVIRRADDFRLAEERFLEWKDELERRFTGRQLQIPPAISAVKVEGERSYRRVRRGEARVLCSREVEIYSLDLTYCGEREIGYRLECSKGTYVRSLARDLGEAVGVPACVSVLRRTASGSLTVNQAVRMDEVLAVDDLASLLRPIVNLLPDVPVLEVNSDDLCRLRCGDQRPLERVVCGGKRTALGREVAIVRGPSGDPLGMIEREPPGGWQIRFLVS